MTRVEANTPAQTIFLPRRWHTEDERGCAQGLSLRMSCQAIRSARPDGRTPWIVRVAGALALIAPASAPYWQGCAKRTNGRCVSRFPA